jgi:hypothetical protein
VIVIALMLVLMVADLCRRGIKPFLARNKLPPLRQEFNQRFRRQILGGTSKKARFRPEPIDDRLAQTLAGVSAAGIQHHLHHLVPVDLSVVLHCNLSLSADHFQLPAIRGGPRHHPFTNRTLPCNPAHSQPRTAKPLTSLKPSRTAAVSQTSRSNARPFHALKPANPPRRHERPTPNIEHPTPRPELHPTITSTFDVRRLASGTAFVPSHTPQPHRSAGLWHGVVP